MAINEIVAGDNAIAITGTATGKETLGVLGTGDAQGVRGEGGNVGVVGKGTNWVGVFGETKAPAAVGSAGVWGDGKDGGDGVKGVAYGPGKAAVCGFHLGTVGDGGPGVYGESQKGRGVQGQGQVGVVGISGIWVGVYGETHASFSAGAAAIWGDGKNSGDGVKGVANAPGKAAVCGFHLGNSGPGVFGKGEPAGMFEGDVRVTRNLQVDGDVTLTNADCAEDFDVRDGASVEPGTVMVLAEQGVVRESDHAYDKRVAGVVSGAGEFRPGLVLDKHASRTNRIPIALLGKVYCKVDASYGQVEVGDPLTTSPTAGHAMKASDRDKAFGAVIGKALTPLARGRGLIPVLVALQ
jgi:hypothetical protein